MEWKEICSTKNKMTNEYEKWEILTIVCVIILSLVFIFLMVKLIYIASTRIDVREEFCTYNLVRGRGDIDYCNGRPFVCGRTGCDYITRPLVGENCEYVGIVGKGGHEECYPVYG